MQRVSVSDSDPTVLADGVRRLELSDSLGATDLALNHYRLAPGEELPAGLHAHADQEELFFVLDGQLTFERYRPEEGVGEELTVAAGQIVRFAPGEFQPGYNDADAETVVLAIGAPRESDDVRIPLPCPACEHDQLRLATDPPVAFVCPDCRAEHAPAPCPDCGGDLRAALGRGDRPVAACRACDAEFSEPPTE